MKMTSNNSGFNVGYKGEKKAKLWELIGAILIVLFAMSGILIAIVHVLSLFN